MTESTIAHLKAKRDLAHKRLADAVNCARRCSMDNSLLDRFQTWCDRLEMIMEAFNDAHACLLCELTKLKDGENQVSEAVKLQEEADDMYFLVIEAKRALFPAPPSKPTGESSASVAKQKNSKLPPIKLPNFNGQLKDFPGFIDLFNTLVHSRPDISNVEKFQYLITSLSGEPINVIRAYPVSEANYSNAYQSLVDRYSNKRYLAFVCWEQIVNLKPMNTGSAQNLRLLLDTYSENISMLGSLGLPTSNWDFVMFHSLLTKLDKASREAFELDCNTCEFPGFEKLKSFLKERCNALERSSLTSGTPTTTRNQTNNNNQTKQINQQPRPAPTLLLAQGPGGQTNNLSCVICKGNHALYMCEKFISKTPRERVEIVKQNKLCSNCLRSNHQTQQCKSTFRCKTCNKFHNSLLHYPSSKSNDNSGKQSLTNQSSSSSDKSSEPKTEENVVTPVTSLANTCQETAQTSTFVLLATAEVEVKTGWGTFQRVRALLDPGSQSHVISSSCARRLGLTCHKAIQPMLGIGGIPSTPAGKVFIEVRPVGEAEPTFSTEALCLDKICSNMPTQPVNTKNFQHIANLKLADQDYHKSRPVDILIGGELFPHLLLPGDKIEGGNRAATAINTIFGYILMGRTESTGTTSSSSLAVSINHLSEDASLDLAVQKFWEIDSIPSQEHKENQSIDEVRCEEIYQATHQRDENGRYIVNLPFRDEEPTFEGSYAIALRRFKHLERRLLQDPPFYKNYKQHIMEYLSNGHMEEIPIPDHQSPSAYYIPHHAVVKPGKIRVVYDASCKDKQGKSLNDSLLTGEKLQADICDILLRFRLHAIVFTADVRQMYLQVAVIKKHQDYQRILFRCSPEEQVREFRLTRVTFGVSSAPFLAIRTMHQLAQDHQEAYPAAVNLLLQDRYVDDLVTGCDTAERAVEHQQQLINLMSEGGFELRKWASNNTEVLQHIPENHRAIPEITFDSESLFMKVLGLAWNSEEDIFTYQVNQIDRECTKRSMLSELARIYDPIGLLTPLTFQAKQLIQRLWLLGTSWDQPVPDEVKQQWTKHTQQLPNLSKLQIPRRITRSDAISYQIHGFSDASEAGYAGVVYLRSTDHHNNHHAALISARSRVAPTKRRTLPRLELCGAVLLTELMQHILRLYSTSIQIQGVYAWSDSTITLAWIKSNSNGYKAFVGNRISSIQRKLPEAIWGHVPGKQNPADCASRGLTPNELIDHDLWWTGPEWLVQDQSRWPSVPIAEQLIPEASGEERKCVLINSTPPEEHFLDKLINKYSSLNKIQRILAYCKRFIDATRKNIRSGHLTSLELHGSLMLLVKHVQHSQFSDEISRIRLSKPLPKSLKSLSPFLDSNATLRVGGRLSRSQLNFEAKHPALLPRKHRLTHLIIQSVHNDNFHPGLQTLQYLLLQNFWVLSARRAIRQVISNCYKCFRVKPHHVQPEMADLPRSRITQIKAFQSVGCDYAGPFNVSFQRYRGSRSMKAYLCLFVCFATKALHLELASSLSSDSFLAALRRFIARRGRCNTIHSDCGTNFKGAHTQLSELMRSACEVEHIEFKFNPAGAPHFGGLWEAGVKSVKTHLYRVIGAQTLTYEELNTLLAQVESILNSRPLCPLSTDPNDLSVLTPGHFLTMAPLTTVPTPDYTNMNINKLTRWQMLQRMHQDFWSRWHTEYLTTLSQRLKWTKSSRPVMIDQIVVIKDETTHPLRWHYGKIIALHPGRDGVCRSAMVRTAHGVLHRPLVKLCPIPDGSD